MTRTFLTCVLAVSVALMLRGATVADDKATDAGPWLVQVQSSLADTDPAAYTGRIEVYAGDRFIGCAWAAYSRPSVGEVRLSPMALGYVAYGPKDRIRVETFGELRRVGGVTIKISPLAAAVIAPQDPL